VHVVIKGRIVRGEPGEQDWLRASASWYTYESFEVSMTNLKHARREYVSPCMCDPDLFDPRTEAEANHNRGRPRARGLSTPFAVRVIEAVKRCRGCEVIEQCREVLGTIDPNNPVTEGVIGGVLVDPTSHGDAIRKALNMPARPKVGGEL
jgi:hypothetical protein